MQRAACSVPCAVCSVWCLLEPYPMYHAYHFTCMGCQTHNGRLLAPCVYHTIVCHFHFCSTKQSCILTFWSPCVYVCVCVCMAVCARVCLPAQVTKDLTQYSKTQMPDQVKRAQMASNSQIRSSLPFQNGAKNHDLRRVLRPSTEGAGSKTRLESRI